MTFDNEADRKKWDEADPRYYLGLRASWIEGLLRLRSMLAPELVLTLEEGMTRVREVAILNSPNWQPSAKRQQAIDLENLEIEL